MRNKRKQSGAFTLIELLVVIIVIAFLASVSLPALARTRPATQRLACANNLKQVAVAFRTWGISYNGNTPMTLPGSQGGNSDTGDIGVHVVGATLAASHGVCKFFYTLQNQLITPKILFCPAEYDTPNRSIATTFAATGGTPYRSDLNVSYFVGIDENEAHPRMLLAGDHNMGFGTVAAPPTAVYGAPNTLGFGPWPANGPAWTALQHNAQGNVGMSDGSVELFNTTRLQSALQNSGDTAVHMAIGGFTTIGGNRLQFPQSGGAFSD